MNNFILRNVVIDDLEDLYELSLLNNLLNLPKDKGLIKKKILSSMQSFKAPYKDKEKNWYIFCLVDTEVNKVIGVSMIHAQHGTQDAPHFFLKVAVETKFSQTINTGFSHGTLKLDHTTDGPSEIGGLVLHPDYRNNKFKLGKQISLVRFLYIALNKDRFKEEIHSELLPPFDEKGNSPLWEAIGRKFMNMDYHEADKLSLSNKEFILSLYPSENIYITLLPIEAKEAIGKVGETTRPVKHMLEKIGFKYTYEVDPFDGGPHYRAKVDEILPIQKTFPIKSLKSLDSLSPEIDKKQLSAFIIELKGSEFLFSAKYVCGLREDNVLYVDQEDYQELSKLSFENIMELS